MSNSEPHLEEEKYGPRVGVQLNLEGANLVLGRHLRKPCKSIQEVKRGFNNRTYIVETTDSNSETYVIRLPGIHWTKIKTEGEVAAIIYLKLKCPDIPLPKIYGYCSDKELSGIGHEYILMEHMIGLPLDDTFGLMSFEDQKIVVTQIARIIAAIKAIKFNKIGSFTFLPRISDINGLDEKVFNDIKAEDIVIGKTVDQGVGPFENWLEYFGSMCSAEIRELTKCKFMEPQMINLERIENFVEKMSDPKRTLLSDVVSSPDLVFMHGDFEPRNILVEGTTVTGLLDLEFSGSFPIDNEWFDGFSDFGASTNEWKVFNEEPGSDQPNSELIKPIRDYFLSECQKFQMPTPNEIPGHYDRAELYWFWCNICPWFLREIREDIPEHWIKERALSIKRIQFVLSKYGF